MTVDTFLIKCFSDRADLSLSGAAELARALYELHEHFHDSPTLVNVYRGSADNYTGLAMVGVGAEMSSVQIIDKVDGKIYRAINNENLGSPVLFSYQDHDTLIKSRLLIPTTVAIAAVTGWIVEGKLDTKVEWTLGPFPPRPLNTAK